MDSYPGNTIPTSNFIVSSSDKYINDYILRRVFSERIFFYKGQQYIACVSFNSLIYSRSLVFCKFAFHGLAKLIQTVVRKFYSYFMVFTPESVFYAIIVLLQQNLCVNQCYGANIGCLIYDVLVEISREFSNEIPNLYTQILYPNPSDLSTPDFCFVFNGATEKFSYKIKDLIGTEFFSGENGYPPFQDHIVQIYEKQIFNRPLPLNGISLVEANAYLATHIPRLIAGNPLTIQFPELNRKTCIMIHILGTIFYHIKVGKIDNFMLPSYQNPQANPLLPIHFSIPDLF